MAYDLHVHKLPKLLSLSNISCAWSSEVKKSKGELNEAEFYFFGHVGVPLTPSAS